MTTIRIYLRALTKDQDAERVLDELVDFSQSFSNQHEVHCENISETRLERPAINKLLNDATPKDILLIESVDRLTRLTTEDFDTLKTRIKAKGLRLVVMDLPTTHTLLGDSHDITGSILDLVNNLLIDLLATMARLDNEKRKERIRQGLARSGSRTKPISLLVINASTCRGLFFGTITISACAGVPYGRYRRILDFGQQKTCTVKPID